MLAAGAEPLIDPRFAEVSRPGEPFDDTFADRRRAWVEGRLDERHATWESPAQAAARFEDGIHVHPGDLVIATHGMVLTAWLVSRRLVPQGKPAGDFWSALSLPDVVTVEDDELATSTGR